ncbi:hypothetical protein [uncultured Algimonas sp.]|uniref:hypothetical protein n=1 Tax=uncultured Algimonas sp. TaxID=1547920 RepID=UPI0026356C61|nr:hypothetical protein [uncultured Algimonas sp.]
MTDPDEIVILPHPDDDEPYYADDIAVERRPRWPLILGAGLVVALSLGAVAAWMMRPLPYDPGPLEARIEALQQEVATLRERPEPVIPTVDLAPLERRIAALEARPTVDPLSEEIVTRLETLQADGFEIPEMPDIPDVEALEARIADLEAGMQRRAVDAPSPSGLADTPPVRRETAVDPKSLPRFPAQTLRDGAAELSGSGLIRRTFARHVRVRGADNPDRLIDLIEQDMMAGRPRAAIDKFDRLPAQLQTLARAWRADMEDALP